MLVKDIMTKDVQCVSPSDSIQKAAQVMQSVNCGCVPVCESKKVTGVVTDRDIVLKCVAKGQTTGQVSDCMSNQVITATPDTDVHEAADMMSQHQIRRLPVCDAQGQLVGICAIGDVATIDIHINEAGDALSRISQTTAPLQ